MEAITTDSTIITISNETLTTYHISDDQRKKHISDLELEVKASANSDSICDNIFNFQLDTISTTFDLGSQVALI